MGEMLSLYQMTNAAVDRPCDAGDCPSGMACRQKVCNSGSPLLFCQLQSDQTDPPSARPVDPCGARPNSSDIRIIFVTPRDELRS
ncbi:hypothetical protein TTRE_0000351801 [Trichuris trichiura]|uniref:Uncharacterized protein n=1 Tax=Trichuris trichiura TaxID=36087 RepID=A0A077Z568_TRITR|nr:hypothetical protein TTRE_0000351801 [Trichuris trichiura]